MIDRKSQTVGRLIIWHYENGVGDDIQASIQRDDRTEVGTGDTVEAAIESLEEHECKLNKLQPKIILSN